MSIVLLTMVILVITYLITFKGDFDKEKLSKAFLFLAVIGIISFVLALFLG